MASDFEGSAWIDFKVQGVECRMEAPWPGQSAKIKVLNVSSASQKILVVEDEALLRFTISDELRDVGYEVFEASNADEAIRVLESDKDIRLIFTDIDMPGSMDGLDLAAMVRDRWPPVRIIVTSGKQRPHSMELPQGGSFMPKPYGYANVAKAIEEMLA